MKEYKGYYKRVEGNEGNKCNYPTRLDTYGCGCQHNCKYCYAKSLLDFRGLWDAEKPAVATIDEKFISKLPKEVVRLGGMTDCYMPYEREIKNTRRTIQLLNKYRVPYLIVTKSALILDDIDILDKQLAHIQITVTTTDDELSRTYENASIPSERRRCWSMNREELIAEINRVEQALQKTTSCKLKHDYGKYLKRLWRDLKYYDKHNVRPRNLASDAR